MIILHTNKGDIKIELDFDKAPVTAKNFEQYVKDGFYDGVIFHRVIKGFMIQGGGMDENMNEKETRDPIQNEASNGLPNEKYTIAMARTSDPHSASAQFFINTADNAFLNFRSKELYGKTVVQDWATPYSVKSLTVLTWSMPSKAFLPNATATTTMYRPNPSSSPKPKWFN